MLKKEMQMVALLFPVFCLPFLQDDVPPNGVRRYVWTKNSPSRLSADGLFVLAAEGEGFTNKLANISQPIP